MSRQIALIDPRNSDNSAATKKITFYGEVIDFIQFMLMTTFSEGIDSVARYGFGEKDYIPTPGLVGMDIFAYSMMIYLAHIRTEKFKERHRLFTDRNSQAYYQKTAQALLESLTEDEKQAIDIPVIGSQINRVIDLLKCDARKISPDNIPAARTKIETALAIFERAKKRPEFARARYNFKLNDLRSEISLAHGDESIFNQVFHDAENKNFEQMQFDYIKAVLLACKEKSFSISDDDIHLFIARLTLLEKSGKLKSKQDHFRLLMHYGINQTNQEKARELLAIFYEHYHTYQDQNDKAYYKGNMRGITHDELIRTQFKSYLFGTVRACSVLAVFYSMGSFASSFLMSLSIYQLYAPLFLVGTTSLVDEASDLYFKHKKYRESQDDLEKWLSNRENKKAYDVFSQLNIQNHDSIQSFTQDSAYFKTIDDFSFRYREPGEPLDLNKHGILYLQTKHKEYCDLTARIERREKKFRQACMSFTGVFFGVLISMTAAILMVTMDAAKVINMLGFAGMGTIAMAFCAGAYMIYYQSHQHTNKGVFLTEKRKKESAEIESKHPEIHTRYPSSTDNQQADHFAPNDTAVYNDYKPLLMV